MIAQPDFGAQNVRILANAKTALAMMAKMALVIVPAILIGMALTAIPAPPAGQAMIAMSVKTSS